MAKAELIPPTLLRQLLDYDAATGALTWRHRSVAIAVELGQSVDHLDAWNAQYAGKVGFTASTYKGYRASTISGAHIRAHRAAWAVHYGAWPDGMLDHINGDKADNRIANLRIVDDVENGRNYPKSRRNKSGQTGVRWNKTKGKWRARITVEGRVIELGDFVVFDDAVSARKAAERRHGFSPIHGRDA